MKLNPIKQMETFDKVVGSNGLLIYKGLNQSANFFLSTPITNKAKGDPKFQARSINSAKGSPDSGRSKAVIIPHITNHSRIAGTGMINMKSPDKTSITPNIGMRL